MVQLTPCVIKSSQFGEVTAYFLDNNYLYCIRKDGFKRQHQTKLRVDLNNLKAWETIPDQEWPYVPERPEPSVTKELVMFTLWLQLCPTDSAFQVYGKTGFKYVDQEEMCLKDFVYLLRNRKVELPALVTNRVDDLYKSLFDAQTARINSSFVPMLTLSEEVSKVVAALYTYHGDGKKLTQGLKALGLNVEVEQNYVTEGIVKGIDNLEELVSKPKEPSE